MATNVHPLTGVELNPIPIIRQSLDFDEAVTAAILRLQGMDYAQIAHRLGTNPARIGEVFTEKTHPGAMAEAVRRIAGSARSKADPKLS
jgi:hypothetical protein